MGFRHVSFPTIVTNAIATIRHFDRKGGQTASRVKNPIPENQPSDREDEKDETEKDYDPVKIWDGVENCSYNFLKTVKLGEGTKRTKHAKCTQN